MHVVGTLIFVLVYLWVYEHIIEPWQDNQKRK